MPSIVTVETNDPEAVPGSSDNSATDEELVTAAKNGSELALEMLIKRYRSRILAVALRYIRVHEDAEDVVQQTLQKAFLHLPTFQGKSSFSTWLTRITINQSLMLLRRHRSAREIPLNAPQCEEGNRQLETVDPSLNPELRYLQQEAVQLLSAALAKLRPGMRIAMELRELREMSGKETAERMGVSVGTVKARVFQGRKKLRQLLRRSARASRSSERPIFCVRSDFSLRRKAA